MKELPEKDKSTYIVGFWGDTWIASELHNIDKIKEGKFNDKDLVAFCKSEKYKNLKPKYSLLRVDGKVIPLEINPRKKLDWFYLMQWVSGNTWKKNTDLLA